MSQQWWHGVDQILASGNGNTLAALIEAGRKVCAAAMGKARCPLGSVTRLSQQVTGHLS